jgi:hypothetical protein
MYGEKELSDKELVNRLQQHDPNAFYPLYRRYDAAVTGSIARVVRLLLDREHVARQIADDLWLKIADHPEYLAGHDYNDRPLGVYLSFLGRREAVHYLHESATQPALHMVHLSDEEICDAGQEMERRADRWQQVVTLLTWAELATVWRLLDRKQGKTNAQKRWLQRLIQKCRRRLGFG